MELRHIRYFVAAAEEISFRRAAKRLHMSEPALGAQIKELERESGIELFERLPRGVRLTTAGGAFLVDARRLLGGLHQAIDHAQCVARGEAGNLHVGHVPRAILRTAGVGSLIPAFCARYPKVDVQGIELTLTEQWTALREGGIDVGIAYAPPATTSDFKSEVVDENLLTGALLPSAHALAHQRPLHCRDLGVLPYVKAPRSQVPNGQDFLVRELRVRGLDVEFVDYEISDAALRVGLVAIGTGWMAANEVAGEALVTITPGVVFREWADAPIRFPCFAFWRDDRNPVVASFLSVARELRDRSRTADHSSGLSDSLLGPEGTWNRTA